MTASAVTQVTKEARIELARLRFENAQLREVNARLTDTNERLLVGHEANLRLISDILKISSVK